MLRTVFAEQTTPPLVSPVPRIPIAEPMATEIKGPPLWSEDCWIEGRMTGMGALALSVLGGKPSYDTAKGDPSRPGVTARKMSEPERWLSVARLTMLINGGAK